jgi:ABC-type sugar transport system ATPase subunit
MTFKTKDAFPNNHSDQVTLAVRCIPTDIALELPEGQLIALVGSIMDGMAHYHQTVFDAQEAAKQQIKRDGKTVIVNTSTLGNRRSGP